MLYAFVELYLDHSLDRAVSRSEPPCYRTYRVLEFYYHCGFWLGVSFSTADSNFFRKLLFPRLLASRNN